MNKKTAPLIVIIVALVIGLGALVFNAPKSIDNTPAPTAEPTPATETERLGIAGKLAPKSVIFVIPDGFSPKAVTVPVGTEVVWVNNVAATANVSSDDHPSHTKYPSLNLGDFEMGKSVIFTATTIGTYTYHNHLKPSQTGTITVIAQ